MIALWMPVPAKAAIRCSTVETDTPDVPILDGSSAPFVTALVARGVRRLAAPLNAIEILRPCEVTLGDATARLEPSETLEVHFEIDFEDAAIGHQERELRMANGAFVHELCDARTFCRLADVTQMRANGLALGGKAGENAVVFNGSDIICPGGLRHSDEPVRHKMLDALGDLALARMPILGRYTGIRAGHAVTNALLRQVMARPNLYRVVEVDDELAARLPGSGVSYFDVAGLIRAA
ncbi:MAG: UDP-3-O-acyl-N-acetylglucosamine deacetylase [Pseudomonadota bacterium]